MGEKITIASIFNTVDVTSRRQAISPRWGSVDEYKWRLRRGNLRLAELAA